VPTVAPAVVAALPPAAVLQLPATTPFIQPPNTGDAGLASPD
jgi:hypothetical protein